MKLINLEYILKEEDKVRLDLSKEDSKVLFLRNLLDISRKINIKKDNKIKITLKIKDFQFYTVSYPDDEWGLYIITLEPLIEIHNFLYDSKKNIEYVEYIVEII